MKSRSMILANRSLQARKAKRATRQWRQPARRHGGLLHSLIESAAIVSLAVGAVYALKYLLLV